MVSLLLAAALAAAPAPRALPKAEQVVYLPRLDRLGGLLAFFDRAGEYSVMLRPSSWRGEFLPLLQVDPTRADSLAAAGLDPAGHATVNLVGDARVTCATVRDSRAFEARALKGFEGQGQPWKARAQGVALVGVKAEAEVVAGYALLGGEACVAQGPGSEGLLKEAAKQLAHPTAGRAWAGLGALPGAAYLVRPEGAIGLDGSADQLQLEGRAARLPLLPLRSGTQSPYGALSPSGLLFARASVEPTSVDRALAALELQVGRACPGCDRAKLGEVSHALARHLTGQVLLRVDRAQPGPSLRSAPARYFAVKHAYLAEVMKPEEVKQVLSPIAGWKGAQATAEGVVLSLPEGRLLLGVRGSHLYLANDEVALEAAFQGLPAKPARLPHGADVAVDPRKVARALARVSLLDALGSKELAALLAVATELGPLLGASESITGWMDSSGAGAHRFSATWRLAPGSASPAAPGDGSRDGGAPPAGPDGGTR